MKNQRNAERRAYICENGVIKKILIKFNWYPGFANTQKIKSIKSLHENISKLEKIEISNILEVSSKSENILGVSLSAFNLKTKDKNNNIFSVETAFQSSKVFENAGPYKDLLFEVSKNIKKDTRLKTSGKLIHFSFFNKKFELEPATFFYDWLYINILLKNPELVKQVMKYNVFTDIEFNHKKSINCQAFSVALFVCLKNRNVDMQNFRDPEIFYREAKFFYENVISETLF